MKYKKPRPQKTEVPCEGCNIKLTNQEYFFGKNCTLCTVKNKRNDKKDIEKPIFPAV